MPKLLHFPKALFLLFFCHFALLAVMHAAAFPGPCCPEEVVRLPKICFWPVENIAGTRNCQDFLVKFSFPHKIIKVDPPASKIFNIKLSVHCRVK